MAQAVGDPSRIALIGVPSSAGARRLGQEDAPRCLRRAGLVERLRSTGLDVVDLGDLAQEAFAPDRANPRQQNLGSVLRVLRDTARAVDAAVVRRAWPLVVGGDCTVTVGVLAGLASRFSRLGMMYFDGDVDLNTPATTPSGAFDGMGLAHILGRGAPELSHLGSRYPLLKESAVTLFGYSLEAGGIDPVEVEYLQHTQMARYPLERIKARAQATAGEAMRELEAKAEHILVHFDVDVIDFNELPVADVPHQPGLSLLETEEALGVFLGSRKAAGLVLTEFNATRDPDGSLAVRLIQALENAMTRGWAARK